VTSSTPLELQSDLRLHTQRPELGRAELLTDALILPFTDIESRLSQLALSSSELDAKQLRKSMKSYLGRLNANPHIPLKFRLKVLSRFEQELNLFDGEMTAAVLNAHKIGVILVQEKARSEPDYYPVLIDMVANAIELSVKLLRLSLEQYRAQTVLATRQFFDLARLGLDVAAACTDLPKEATTRLFKAICNHELLRKMDFFAHPPAMQQRIWLELQFHVGVLQPQFLRQGVSPAATCTAPLLLTNLNRPNNPASVSLQLTEALAFDAFVIPLAAFTERVEMAVHHAGSILHQPDMQKQVLHTEHELENTMLGCTAILNALNEEPRQDERGSRIDARIVLQLHATKALQQAFAGDDGYGKKEPTQQNRTNNTWRIANLHADGVCLERVDSGSVPQIVGALVGLHWLLPEVPPDLPFCRENPQQIPELKRLGIVRWIKAVKPGEQQLGITFIEDGYLLAQAVMLGGGQDAEARRTWPVLLRRYLGKRSMILPETGIYREMTFMLSQAGRQAPFKVSDVEQAALNYTCCHIVLANTTNNSTS